MEATVSTTIEKARMGDVVEFVDYVRGRHARLIRGRVSSHFGNGTTVVDCECVSDTRVTAPRYTLLDGHAVQVVDA